MSWRKSFDDNDDDDENDEMEWQDDKKKIHENCVVTNERMRIINDFGYAFVFAIY